MVKIKTVQMKMNENAQDKMMTKMAPCEKRTKAVKTIMFRTKMVLMKHDQKCPRQGQDKNSTNKKGTEMIQHE